MDRHLSMVDQISATCAACNYHIHRRSSIRRYLTEKATKNAVQALITSRLDYCNSLLIGIPSEQLNRLQRIQNKAARLVTLTKRRESITPVLQNLHWLPVESRIHYKSLLLAFKCQHGQAHTYLSDLLRPHEPDSRLRQDNGPKLVQPRSKKLIGEQGFGVAAPRLWNSIPTELRAIDTLYAFKKII